MPMLERVVYSTFFVNGLCLPIGEVGRDSDDLACRYTVVLWTYSLINSENIFLSVLLGPGEKQVPLVAREMLAGSAMLRASTPEATMTLLDGDNHRISLPLAKSSD